MVSARVLPPRLGRLGLDPGLDRQKAAVGVAQEDQAHDGQEVLVAGVVGVGAQGVRRTPKAIFDGFDMFELGHAAFFSLYVFFYD